MATSLHYNFISVLSVRDKLSLFINFETTNLNTNIYCIEDENIY